MFGEKLTPRGKRGFGGEMVICESNGKDRRVGKSLVGTQHKNTRNERTNTTIAT